MTLLLPTDDFVYWPMAVAEPFGRGHAAHYPLAEIAAAVDARMVCGRLAAVDCSSQVAITAAGTRLAYDALLVAVGAHAEPALRGAVTWTPEADAEVCGGLLRDLEEGYSKRIAFVAPPPATTAPKPRASNQRGSMSTSTSTCRWPRTPYIGPRACAMGA